MASKNSIKQPIHFKGKQIGTLTVRWGHPSDDPNLCTVSTRLDKKTSKEIRRYALKKLIRDVASSNLHFHGPYWKSIVNALETLGALHWVEEQDNARRFSEKKLASRA